MNVQCLPVRNFSGPLAGGGSSTFPGVPARIQVPIASLASYDVFAPSSAGSRAASPMIVAKAAAPMIMGRGTKCCSTNLLIAGASSEKTQDR